MTKRLSRPAVWALLVISTGCRTKDGGGPREAGLPGAPPLERKLSERLRAALAAKGPAYVPRTRHLVGKRRSTPTGSSSRRAPTSCSTRTIRSTGTRGATRRSRRRGGAGVPVFLSVGYSTCHWCHVMEVESFEDEEIARYLNSHYVCIKVDREERPDVDAVYMSAVQALTGSGGWPMSVWLTPAREPFFGGTYFPPRDGDARRRAGASSTLLTELAELYRKDPARVAREAATLAATVRRELEEDVAGATVAPVLPRARRLDPRIIPATVDEPQARVRRRERRPPARAQVPVEPPGAAAAALPPPHRRRGGAAHGDADAREDGRRRHLRPARRRLSPLRDRRRLAGPALREDALRQRAARGGVPRGLPGDGAAGLRPRGPRDARLRPARDDRAGGGVLLRDRRGLRGEEGKFFVWSEARDPRAARRRTRIASSAPTASPARATSRAGTSSTSPTPTRPSRPR